MAVAKLDQGCSGIEAIAAGGFGDNPARHVQTLLAACSPAEYPIINHRLLPCSFHAIQRTHCLVIFGYRGSNLNQQADGHFLAQMGNILPNMDYCVFVAGFGVADHSPEMGSIGEP